MSDLAHHFDIASLDRGRWLCARVRQFCSGEMYPCTILYPSIPNGIDVVYQLIDPRNGEVFYIGRTRQFRSRIRAHCILNLRQRLDRRKAEIHDDNCPIWAKPALITRWTAMAEAAEFRLIKTHRKTALNIQTRRWREVPT